MTDPERLREALAEWDEHGQYDWGPDSDSPAIMADAARSYLRILEADDQLVEEVVAIFDKWDYQLGGNRGMLLNDFAKKEMARAVLARLGGNG